MSYFGKYRGQVTNNVDPLMLGRVQVSVPSVLGDGRMSWAMPCVPYAGNGVGIFMVPPVGANVWIEFEAGDTDYPILAGCFWGQGEVPAMPAIPTTKMIKTDGVTLTLDDLPGAGGLKLEVAAPVSPIPILIDMNGASGIEITYGAQTIKLSQVNINVNNGALEII